MGASSNDTPRMRDAKPSAQRQTGRPYTPAQPSSSSQGRLVDMRTMMRPMPVLPGRPVTVTGGDQALARQLDLVDAAVVGQIAYYARRRIELTGGPTSRAFSVAKDTLREAMRRQWDEPRLPGRLAGGRRSWPTGYPWSGPASAALAAQGPTRLEKIRGLGLDHVTPLDVGLVVLLDEATPLDPDSLAKLLPDLLGGVVITEAEHAVLAAAGLGSRLPLGADSVDAGTASRRHPPALGDARGMTTRSACSSPTTTSTDPAAEAGRTCGPCADCSACLTTR